MAVGSLHQHCPGHGDMGTWGQAWVCFPGDSGTPSTVGTEQQVLSTHWGSAARRTLSK